MKYLLVHLFGVWCATNIALSVFGLPVDNNVVPMPEIPQAEQGDGSFTRVNALQNNNIINEPSITTPAPTKQRIGKAPEEMRQETVYPPTIVELNCSQNLATLRWQYPYDQQVQSKHFRILYSENSSQEWSESPYDIQNTETSVKYLYPNIDYRFRVVATLKDGRKIESETSYCKTKEDFPVRNPTIISAYRRNKREVRVRWEALKPQERGASGDIFYNVYLFQPESDDVRRQIQMRSVSEQVTELTFKDLDLDDYKHYSVWVNSLNKLGGSRESVHLIEVSQETRPHMSPGVTSVNVIDANNATVTWNSVPLSSVNGEFEAYVLKFYQLDANSSPAPMEVLYRQNNTLNTYNASLLRPDTAYNVTISLKNGLDELGPESLPYNFRTKKYSLPKKAKFTFMQKCSGKYDGPRLVFKREVVYKLLSESPEADSNVTHYFQYCFLPENKYRGNSEQCFQNRDDYGEHKIDTKNTETTTSFGEEQLNDILFVRVLSKNGDLETYSDIQQSSTGRWEYICNTTVTTTPAPPPTTTIATEAPIYVPPQDGEERNNNQFPSDDDLVTFPNTNEHKGDEPEGSSNVVIIVLIVVGIVVILGLMVFAVLYMKSRPKPSPQPNTTIEARETQALNGQTNEDEDDKNPYEPK